MSSSFYTLLPPMTSHLTYQYFRLRLILLREIVVKVVKKSDDDNENANTCERRAKKKKTLCDVMIPLEILHEKGTQQQQRRQRVF